MTGSRSIRRSAAACSRSTNPGSGVASNTILDSGASQDDRASANLTTINFGGVQDVFAGGLATSSFVNSGGFLSASSGTVVSATVRSGGLILLDVGAQGSAIELDSGGAVLLLPGATMVETVSSGGNVISSGVVDFDYSTDTIVSSSAAPVSGAMVSGSGVNQDEFVLSAGIADRDIRHQFRRGRRLHRRTDHRHDPHRLQLGIC